MIKRENYLSSLRELDSLGICSTGRIVNIVGGARGVSEYFYRMRMIENPAFYAREQLFLELERKVGERNMTEENIIKAINDGTGEEQVLELQRIDKKLRNDKKYKNALDRVVPDMIAFAIRSYKIKKKRVRIDASKN